MQLDFILFLIIAIVNALIYTHRRLEIFDWNPELEYYTEDKTKNVRVMNGVASYPLKHRKKINYPCEWKINNAIHMFLGVIIGWFMLWLLYSERLKPLLTTGCTLRLEWSDFALFILGYIGIKGRLPTIADSVRDWFKRG